MAAGSWHSGVDADAPGDCTTRCNMARPCHPLPAHAEGACEAPVYSLTCSQSCAHDLPISWWSHVEHWLGMLEPPPVVLTDRALEILWLRRALSGTLGPAWIQHYGPGAVRHPAHGRGWWRCETSRVPGPSGPASTSSSRRAGRRSGAHSYLMALPTHPNYTY